MGRLNLVVARYRDGYMVKGITYDFARNKKSFHVHVATDDQKRIEEVNISDLKAVFFVKSLEGSPEYQEKKEFPVGTPGLKIKVEFFDGEILLGTTSGYSAQRQGFWLFPADPESNNLRIYVVCAAVKKIEKIGLQESEEEELIF